MVGVVFAFTSESLASCAVARATPSTQRQIAASSKSALRMKSSLALTEIVGASSVSAIPADKHKKDSRRSDGQTRVHAPSAQFRHGHDRDQRRDHHYKGGFALGQFFLFNHSPPPRAALCCCHSS